MCFGFAPWGEANGWCGWLSTISESSQSNCLILMSQTVAVYHFFAPYFSHHSSYLTVFTKLFRELYWQNVHKVSLSCKWNISCIQLNWQKHLLFLNCLIKCLLFQSIGVWTLPIKLNMLFISTGSAFDL